jgi:hypothetical protein
MGRCLVGVDSLMQEAVEKELEEVGVAGGNFYLGQIRRKLRFTD